MTDMISTRPASNGAETMLQKEIKVLDKGFVRLVDYMGTDNCVVQAAQVSYGLGTKKGSDTRSLIRYLLKHWHTTPFEMAEVKLHVKLPVFVARQWIRHRMANVNEYSARYSILDREFYIPDGKDIQAQSTTNKQGREENGLDGGDVAAFREMLLSDSEDLYDKYFHNVTPKDEGGRGIARELARMNLPTNIYTQWYWKVDAHNLMHFLRLRADSHAQYEIRMYAEAILNQILSAWLPLTHEAFLDYRYDAAQFSAQEMTALRNMLSYSEAHPDLADLSEREKNEFWSKIAAER